MALDPATSLSATLSISATETPSTTLSAVSTTTSSVFTTPLKNGKNHSGYLSPHAFSPQTRSPHATTTFGPISPLPNLESSLTPKDIVIQLRQLAQDPHQQIHLINNTESLSILSNALLDTTTSSATEMCIIALQTLQLLSSNPNYRDTLKSIPNLNQRIETLCLSPQQRIQLNAKNLKTTIHSNAPLNKAQQYQPRPLHKIEFAISNLNTETDRDEIQTIGIKISGIISVTVNMSSRLVTFYATKEHLRRQIALKLRGNGFQVLSEDPSDADDLASVHSGISNFVDEPKAQLSSLMADNSSPFRRRTASKTSIIQERYALDEDDPEAETKGDNVSVGSGGLFSLQGPSYLQPPDMVNKSGITKYKPRQRVESLAQRLQREQMMADAEANKQKQTQGYLAKVISYVW